MVQKCQLFLEKLNYKASDTEALTQLSASCKGKEKLLSQVVSKGVGLGLNSPFSTYLLTRLLGCHCAGDRWSDRESKLLPLNSGLETRNQMP